MADFADLLILLLRDGLCYFLLLNKVLTGQISAGMFVIMFAAVSNFSNCVNEIVKYYGELKGDCRQANSLHNILNVPYQSGNQNAENEEKARSWFWKMFRLATVREKRRRFRGSICISKRAKRLP